MYISGQGEGKFLQTFYWSHEWSKFIKKKHFILGCCFVSWSKEQERRCIHQNIIVGQMVTFALYFDIKDIVLFKVYTNMYVHHITCLQLK